MPEAIIESSRHAAVPQRQRPRALGLFLLVVAGALLGRTFYLQVLRGGQFQVQAEGNRVAVVPLQAPRGIIYDRFGTQLIENVASTDVLIDPTSLPRADEIGMLLERLPALLGVAPEEVQMAVERARQTQRDVLLRKALVHDAVLEMEGALASLPGVRLSSALVRRYLYAQALASVLGYASSITPEELAHSPDRRLTEVTGKAGLEYTYEKGLRGQSGARYVEVNADMRAQREVRAVPPVAGADLHLTLDAELQQFVFNLLAEHVRVSASGQTAGAAAVALDPRSGAVRALVSYPSYDPNLFSQPAKADGAAVILTDEAQPLLNRAIAGLYPPGSIIKPLLAAAGLAEGIITPATTVLSTGGIRIGPWFFPDWAAGGHGPTTVTKAIAQSVNTFFYQLAGGDAHQPGLGVAKIAAYLRAFGWGEHSGIDLPGEKPGLIPTAEWKEREKGERWYIGDTYHLGIGQGDILTTPLQVARATAAVANGGLLVKPYLVERQLSSTGSEVLHEAEGQRVPVAREHLTVVREGMRQAVTEGSARRLSALPLALAGKTGTAQFSSSQDTHAWFTSFGPLDNPELVVTVLLEGGGEGDEAAVPLAGEIWQWWAEKRKIQN